MISSPGPATSRSSSRRTGATSCTRCAAASRRACPTSASWPAPSAATGVLAELRGDGVPEELLARIDVPAGIDIGARTPAEIALSILARIVAVRHGTPAARAGRRPAVVAGAAAQPSPTLAVDPICGMTVAAVASTPSVSPGRRDDLLLLRGLQGEVRGAAAACRRHRLTRFVTGLVLGAGGSARLGRPKQLLPVRRRRRCSATSSVSPARARFDQLIVAIGGAAGEVRAARRPGRRRRRRERRLRRRLLVVDRGGAGAVDPRCDVLVLLLGDQPGVTAATVAALLAGRGDAPLAVCRYDDGPRPPDRVSRAACSASWPALHGDKGVWRLLDRRAAEVAEVPVAGPDPARRRHRGRLPGGARRRSSPA